MKEKLNSIICELENINDELRNQEASVDNQVSDIEYSVRNLNDVSSELYDLRTRVNNIQTDISIILDEVESDSTTIGYSKEQVDEIIRYVITIVEVEYQNLISNFEVNRNDILKSVDKVFNSQTEERDEL